MPGAPPADHGDKAERAPHKDEHRDRYRNPLREFGAGHSEQASQHQVEEDVGGLADHHQTLRLAGFDQLREPGIVDVAGKVSGLYPGLPVDRRQHQDRRQHVPAPSALARDAGRGS